MYCFVCSRDICMPVFLSLNRTCLRYFLPPQWVMNKETILQMSLQELSEFPLDEFFDHYERGLRRVCCLQCW